MCTETLKKGDIVFSFSNKEKIGNIQGGRRPYLIISNDKYCTCNTSAINVIPISSRCKSSPVHVSIKSNAENGLPVDSFLLVEQITTIDKSEIHSVIGTLRNNYHLLKEIERKIMFQFSIIN